MKGCIFCKIVRGDLPSERVYADDLVYAFRDINPAAATHILVVPREHLEQLCGAAPGTAAVLGHLLHTAASVAEAAGVAESGYRLVINQGADAGQIVDHLHLHILGGERLGGLG